MPDHVLATPHVADPVMVTTGSVPVPTVPVNVEFPDVETVPLDVGLEASIIGRTAVGRQTRQPNDHAQGTTGVNKKYGVVLPDESATPEAVPGYITPC